MKGMRYCKYNPHLLCDLKHIRDIPYCLNCAIAHGYIVNAHQQNLLKQLPAVHITTTELNLIIDNWQ